MVRCHKLLRGGCGNDAYDFRCRAVSAAHFVPLGTQAPAGRPDAVRSPDAHHINDANQELKKNLAGVAAMRPKRWECLVFKTL